MSLQVVEPRIRGFICTTAHPAGCARHVDRQVAVARRDPGGWAGGNLLVLGSSTGYGLASRVAGAFGHGMHSVGVCFERPATDRRTASAGWYNTAAFDAAARGAGLYATSINGDAFSAEVLEATLDRVRRDLGPLDVVVYSLAAPRRTDPETGQVYNSVLKTVGQPSVIKTVDLHTGVVADVTLDPATPEEIHDTVAVMGGADLRRWVEALLKAGLLARGARVVSYSYIGPEATWPIYRHGTIGHAKADLEVTSASLHELLARTVGGRCHVSINKSIVTQASAAIPAVPIYMSVLFKLMKAAGTHEGPIEQMVRLFDHHIGPGRTPVVDAEGRIRLDDLEMRPEIQAEAMRIWSLIGTDNLRALSDYDGFQRYFRQLFGFDIPGVDYSLPVETEVPAFDAA